MSAVDDAFARVENAFGRDFTPRTPREAVTAIGVTAFVTVVLVVTLIPIVWIVLTSFKEQPSVLRYPPQFVPDFTLGAYAKLFGQTSSMQYSGVDASMAFTSSIVVSLASTAIALALGVPAGYAYARNAGKIGGHHAAFWILSVRMFPPIAPILPLFFIFQNIGLVGTRTGLILLYLTFNVPLVVWLMRSFFRDVPKALEEAAMMDGYSRFQAFYKVSLPMVMPGLVATALLTWIFAWNEFQFALVFGKDTSMTFPVMFIQLHSAQNVLWNQMAALSTLGMLPIIVISVFLQKRLVRGLSLGAVKG